MAQLVVGGLVREIDVVVLDKDGTLIDFDKAWGGRLARGIDAIVALAEGGLASAKGDRTLETALYSTLGGQASDGAILPDGPYVSASIAETGIWSRIVTGTAKSCRFLTAMS